MVRTFRRSGRATCALAILICVASGILSSMVNLAFTFGDDSGRTALRLGMSATLPSTRYGCRSLFRASCRPLSIAFTSSCATARASVSFRPCDRVELVLRRLMGLLFVTGLSLYGIGSLRLGTMGPVLGFPVYTSAMVLSANIAGFLTGEWRRSPLAAYVYEILGILLLIGSIVVIAAGNRTMA